MFHLESLRLRRDKLQTSGAKVSENHCYRIVADTPQNLETFNDDLNKTLTMAMEAYIDTLHGTAATNAQATQVAREAIEAISLDKDST